MKVVDFMNEVMLLRTAQDMPHAEAVQQVRTTHESKHNAQFHIFTGVQYDTKSDRYVAKFDTTGSGRKFTLKCAPQVAAFLTQHNEVRGQWLLTLDENGVLTDVDILVYN